MFFNALHRMIKRTFHSAVVFHFLRRVINFGDLIRKIFTHAGLTGKESILDVGCGVGEYSALTQGDYLGIDHNEDYIRYANRRYADKTKKFIRGDVTRLKIGKRYDLGLYVSMMHHFNEKENLKILGRLSRLSRKVVVVDLLDSPRWIKHLFILLDRGPFIRPLAEQKRILARTFVIEKSGKISTNSGSADLSLFVLRPRKK